MAQRPITAQQKKFAEIFLATQDRKKSLEQAGYSLKNVSVASAQLLHNPKIMAYMEERSKSLMVGNIDEITAIVKGLDKKEAACHEIWKCYQAIKDEKNPTKYKWFELLCKLKGHFSESATQNLFITKDGKPLSVADIIEGTGRLTGVMREIRFEAEILKKKRESEPIQDIVAQDIEPTTN